MADDNAEEIHRNKITAVAKAFLATKPVKQDNIPCQIQQGLFLGSLGAALNKDSLKNLNITHILTVATSINPAYPNDFIYKQIEVTDREDTDLARHFNESFDFIDEAIKMGGAVLVHCFAGKSRSVTLVIAYLMKKNRMSLAQAFERVKSKRPRVAPNAGFLIQLQNFQGLLGDEVENRK